MQILKCKNIIQSVKQNAILINAARGGIVDEGDLTRAIGEGYLWGAGLDCHEQEAPNHERYGALWENLNVVSTPHIGAATRQAQTGSAMHMWLLSTTCTNAL